MRILFILLFTTLSYTGVHAQIDPYNWGIYYSLDDFSNGKLVHYGKFIKADPTGYWIEFFQNNNKIRVKANESKIWGYKDVYGFSYRIIGGKFCPIVEEGPIILYSNRTIPRRNPEGLWEMRVKSDWVLAARSHAELPIRLTEIMHKDIVASWLEQEGEVEMSQRLKRDIFFSSEVAAERMYKVILSFNKSKRTPK